jgi:hypothetical protein
MSCWVVPSLAADIWHIPLEQLWRRIREGEIPTHHEDGFTFVDMASRVREDPATADLHDGASGR